VSVEPEQETTDVVNPSNGDEPEGCVFGVLVIVMYLGVGAFVAGSLGYGADTGFGIVFDVGFTLCGKHVSWNEFLQSPSGVIDFTALVIVSMASVTD